MKLPEIFRRKEKKPKCTYDDHPTWYGKVWHFLAHDDSWLSFVVDAIIVILIGKFLLFPAIGFALGTDYPVVAVISGSMDHQGQDFDEWWVENGEWYETKGITKEQFQTFYRSNGFQKGDALVVKNVPAAEYKVGDVIVYSVPHRTDPIIHRIVAINNDGQLYFSTKGDANLEQLAFEKEILQNQIHGKTILWTPLFGWPKNIFLQITGQI